MAKTNLQESMTSTEKKAWSGRMRQFKSLHSHLREIRQMQKDIGAEIQSLQTQGVNDIGDYSYITESRARLVGLQHEEEQILESLSKLKKGVDALESSSVSSIAGSVTVGSTVVYRCQYSADEVEERIVKIGVTSEIIGKDIPVITTVSPLGKALMNHAPGFKGMVPCPNGTSYEITIIEVK